jgi:hypothetical protein
MIDLPDNRQKKFAYRVEMAGWPQHRQPTGRLETGGLIWPT